MILLTAIWCRKLLKNRETMQINYKILTPCIISLVLLFQVPVWGDNETLVPSESITTTPTPTPAPQSVPVQDPVDTPVPTSSEPIVATTDLLNNLIQNTNVKPTESPTSEIPEPTLYPVVSPTETENIVPLSSSSGQISTTPLSNGTLITLTSSSSLLQKASLVSNVTAGDVTSTPTATPSVTVTPTPNETVNITPTPTPTVTVVPTITVIPTVTATATPTPTLTYYPPPFISPPMSLNIEDASISDDAAPGKTSDITITLSNLAPESSESQITLVLEPANLQARTSGSETVTLKRTDLDQSLNDLLYPLSGKSEEMFQVTFPIPLPESPGNYLYAYYPKQTLTNQYTGEQETVSAGSVIKFTVTITPDARVNVSSG